MGGAGGGKRRGVQEVEGEEEVQVDEVGGEMQEMQDERRCRR